MLQGIDAAFDKYDARKNKARVRRVNGLAYCAQEVISAVDAMQEAAVGAALAASPADQVAQQGFEQERIAAHLEAAAQQLDKPSRVHRWLRSPIVCWRSPAR